MDADGTALGAHADPVTIRGHRTGEPAPGRMGIAAAHSVEGTMINLSIPKDEQELKPRITVIGVGGAGATRSTT
jgi:hypothetical protein